MDLIDPDAVFGVPTSSGTHPYADLEQLYNKVLEGDTRYATAEAGRWVLNGKWGIFPDSPSETDGETAFISETQSNTAGYFETETWVQLNVSNLSILQAAAVHFTGIHGDGYGIDFRIDIYSGPSLEYTQEVTENWDRAVFFDGFTIYAPTAIRVTFTRWSLPGRYARTVEIVPGLFEVWDGGIIYSIDQKEQVDMSCLTLPYGTLILDAYNAGKRFNPRNKSSIFSSIEDRQAIPLRIGPELPDGSVEYIPAGTYYQKNAGWETLYDGLIMRFKLVDIIGLFADRRFAPPTPLPTSASGWIEAILSHLGGNFTERYIIDDDLTGISLTCSADNLTSISCGDLCRYVCMAIGAFPRADKATGYLRISKPPLTGGVTITRDNMPKWPDQAANSDIAAITFRLNDGSDTQYTVSGTHSAANKAPTVANPFIKTAMDAQAAAAYILRFYSGQTFKITSRGDMRSEMGDVDAADLGDDEFAGGSRIYNQYKMSNAGIIKDVQSILQQGTGGEVYANNVTITSSGKWTGPAGITSIRLVIVQGGTGGDTGEWGDWGGGWSHDGAPGKGGLGGKIFIATININDGQEFDVSIGAGGPGGIASTQQMHGSRPGSPGSETTFGNYTSANGMQYESWVDLATSKAYGVTGATGGRAATPKTGDNGASGTGNGGGGGSGGVGSVWLSPSQGGTLVSPQTPGGSGGNGGSGIVLISYN
jgi:hypothetical protein